MLGHVKRALPTALALTIGITLGNLRPGYLTLALRLRQGGNKQ